MTMTSFAAAASRSKRNSSGNSNATTTFPFITLDQFDWQTSQAQQVSSAHSIRYAPLLVVVNNTAESLAAWQVYVHNHSQEVTATIEAANSIPPLVINVMDVGTTSTTSAILQDVVAPVWYVIYIYIYIYFVDVYNTSAW
jgi:hypothetical protein